MVDCKISRKDEYTWNPFSAKVILLVISVVFTFMFHSNSLEADSITEINCSESNTCKKCTNKSLCSWSIELQSCINTKLLQALHGNLTVHNEMHCPIFTVVNKSSVAGVSFKYTVRISNDMKGAVTSFLNSSTITCCIESCDFRGSVVDDSIVCAAIRTPWSYFADGARALISYIYVMFGGKKLQFDNDADHYYTIYDRGCGLSAAAAAADDCATCMWNDRFYKHYLKWCPTDNPCTGSYQIYDKRDAESDKKFLFAEDDVVRIRCAEISILSVRPLYAPRTDGGITTMTITVRNHRMLADNRTVTVAVAGRRCEDPVTYDDRTITCSLLQSSVITAAATAAGPVEVVYASLLSSARSLQNMRFALTSSEIIGFVDPETTSVRPTCGPINGGITLTVHGQFLDAGNAVRVSVVANVSETEVGETVLMTCDTVSRDRHTIVCRTAAAARHNNYNASGASSAKVRVQFDGGPIKYVQSPASWALCAIGESALDAGQTFGGTVSGGTSVPVHGVRFSCVADAQFYVHDRDGARYQHATGCRVVNDTYMECRSPDMRRASFAVDVATAAVFPDFGVRARDCGEGRVSDLPVLQLQQQRLSATSVRSPFFVYADPVYVDFKIRNGAVIISSSHPSSLGQGYMTSDVAVRFRNSTGGCHVTSLSQHEIVCEPTSKTTATVLDQLRCIVVTVGGDGGYECDVQKKSINAWNNSSRGSRSLLFTSVTFFCCSGVAIISGTVLLFAVGVLLFRVITKNRYVISGDT